MASLFACAVREGGATCWGDRKLLGNGKVEVLSGAAMPSAVAGIEDAEDVALGTSHGCLLRRGGAVACWGAGSGDRFGVGPSPTNKYVVAPLPVRGLPVAAQVVAGEGHTCARTPSGQVLCWGSNAQGETGGPADGLPQVVEAPTIVEGIEDAVALSAGEHRTCALRRSGDVSCWGTPLSALYTPCSPDKKNSSCRLPPREERAALEAGRKPTNVPDLHGAVEISSTDNFTCGRMPSGEIVCTGLDTLSALGDARSEGRARTVHVPGIAHARRLAVGAWAACAVEDPGRVLCWGGGPIVGQQSPSTPRPVEGIADAVDVAVSTLSACAVTRSGEVRCWGDGDHGVTGRGATKDTSPAPVRL